MVQLVQFTLRRVPTVQTEMSLAACIRDPAFIGDPASIRSFTVCSYVTSSILVTHSHPCLLTVQLTTL